MKVAFYARGRDDAADRRVARVAARAATTSAGAPDDRRTTRKNVEKRAKSYRGGVWMQTLLRDPAAGLMHSLLYFGFVVAVHRHGASARPTISCPDRFKFLHGQTYEAYSAGAEIAGLMFLVGIVLGDRRAATCSARTASASRPSPKTRSSSARSSSSGSPASSSKRRASRPRASPTSRSGRSSATAARQARRHVVAAHARRSRTGGCGACTWSRSSPSSRSCRPRSCATCSRRR